MNIGANSGNPGALSAQGTADHSIVFTSNQVTPAAGDWQGIRFYDTTADAATSLAGDVLPQRGTHMPERQSGRSRQGALRQQGRD
jgi:hypothetical protein